MTDTDFQTLVERIHKLEMSVQRVAAHIESEQGNVTYHFKDLRAIIQKYDKILSGNGKLGIIGKVDIMWGMGIFVISTIAVQAIALVRIIYFP